MIMESVFLSKAFSKKKKYFTQWKFYADLQILSLYDGFKETPILAYFTLWKLYMESQILSLYKK